MKRQGGQEMGKAWRSLQLGGNTASSTGAGVMGNLIRDINTGVTNAGLQAAAGLRGEVFNASKALYDMGEQSTLRKLAAFDTANQTERYLNDLAAQAQWNFFQQKAMWQHQMAQTYGPMILGSTPDYDVTETPNVFSQLSGPLSELAGALMKPTKKPNLFDNEVV